MPVCKLCPQVVVVTDEFTVRLRVADMVWAGVPESETLKVSDVALAVAVGVPVIAPVDWLSESPAGSMPLVSDQVYGVAPPVAASIVL